MKSFALDLSGLKGLKGVGRGWGGGGVIQCFDWDGWIRSWGCWVVLEDSLKIL